MGEGNNYFYFYFFLFFFYFVFFFFFFFFILFYFFFFFASFLHTIRTRQEYIFKMINEVKKNRLCVLRANFSQFGFFFGKITSLMHSGA
ncbi:hypothetical protein O3M35_007662 [Rhynocoris fuscipes]|uniref:ATP synthase F0 subunit 8 n=1 Tax=Rhynocoris fuscipes TaxID=488301 RepID=A0AAW1DAD3_9HEMI